MSTQEIFKNNQKKEFVKASVNRLIDGKYSVKKKIGSGGMSSVYLAENKAAKGRWAIKVIEKVSKRNSKDGGCIREQIIRQSLIAERDILKRLSHPHLLGVRDVVESEDKIFLVMEYVEGRTLEEIIQKDDYYESDALKWILQLCDVLGYLHSRKTAVIYQDLKPKNIMISNEGDVKLIDFGTAVEIKNNGEDFLRLGTKGFCAPEQQRNGQITNRTDIYALGMTLLYLFTRRNPSAPGFNKNETLNEINSYRDRKIKMIIRRCISDEPEERFRSASELYYQMQKAEGIRECFRKNVFGGIFYIRRLERKMRLTGTFGEDVFSGIRSFDDYREIDIDTSTSGNTLIDLTQGSCRYVNESKLIIKKDIVICE